MKHIKTLGLIALAATAVMAFVGAGTASATELYQRTAGGTVTLGKGTKIESSLSGGTAKLTTTGGSLLDTCTGGGVSGTTSTAGSSTTTVLGGITSLTWTGCLEPTETSVNGELEIHHIASTTNGTVTGKNSVVKVNTTIFEAICEYTVGSALDLGELIGAKTAEGNATLAINTVVPAKNSFFCPDARWEANYTVTIPKGLVVEAS